MAGSTAGKRKRANDLVGDKSVQMELAAPKLVPNNQSIVAEFDFNNGTNTPLKLRRGSIQHDYIHHNLVHRGGGGNIGNSVYGWGPSSPRGWGQGGQRGWGSTSDAVTVTIIPSPVISKTIVTIVNTNVPPKITETVTLTTIQIKTPPPGKPRFSTTTIIESYPPKIGTCTTLITTIGSLRVETVTLITTKVESLSLTGTEPDITTLNIPSLSEIMTVTTTTTIAGSPGIGNVTSTATYIASAPLPETQTSKITILRSSPPHIETVTTTTTSVGSPGVETGTLMSTETTLPPAQEIETITATTTVSIFRASSLPITATLATTIGTAQASVGSSTPPGSVTTATLSGISLAPPSSGTALMTVSVPIGGGSSALPSGSSPTSIGVVPDPSIKLASGLGNRVNLLIADIPYDNGLLQITDGWFTVPEGVSNTLAHTNLTAFLNLLKQVNLTDYVDNLHRITIFAPSNYGISVYRNATTGQIKDLVYSLIVPNFLGYLPALTDGLVLSTLANTTITIAVRNGLYFANGVKIIDPDLLTDNGVINAVDGVVPSGIAQSSDSVSLPKSIGVPLIIPVLTVAIWLLY